MTENLDRDRKGDLDIRIPFEKATEEKEETSSLLSSEISQPSRFTAYITVKFVEEIMPSKKKITLAVSFPSFDWFEEAQDADFDVSGVDEFIIRTALIKLGVDEKKFDSADNLWEEFDIEDEPTENMKNSPVDLEIGKGRNEHKIIAVAPRVEEVSK